MSSQNNHLSQFVKSDLSNNHFLLRTLNNNTFQFLIRWSSSSKPANFSHVKCVWFSSLNFLGFLKKTWHSNWCLRSPNDFRTSPKIPKDFQRMPNVAVQSAKSWHHLTKITHIHILARLQRQGALSIYEKNPEISVVAKVEFPIGKKLFHLVVNPGTWRSARPWTWNWYKLRET